MKYKGFDEEGFVEHLVYEYATHEWMIDLIENVISYAQKHEHVSKDQFCNFITNIFPEISFGEVATFADDDILTEDKIKWKEAFLKDNRR